MQKLIIADDERVIRETIYNLIDWKRLGIEVAGLCKDGIEAYNMILDEAPDIVMTDIRMPGISGLELVKKIAQTDQQIQFIILSGYDEFEYAQEAMKYGVKHYLLKPCNETKILESIQKAGEDCRAARLQAEIKKQQDEMLNLIHQDVMDHMIIDGIFRIRESQKEFWEDMETQMAVYNPYLDMDQNECYLYYLYFFERKYLDSFLETMDAYAKNNGSIPVFYGVYVKNTLMLFCRGEIDEELLRIWCDPVMTLIEIKKEIYQNLSALLKNIVFRLRRYDVIYIIHHAKPIVILNNQNNLCDIQNICSRLQSTDRTTVEQSIAELLGTVQRSTRLEFLQMLGNSICTCMAKIGVCSISEEMHFIRESNQESDIERLRQLIETMVKDAEEVLCRTDQEYGILTERIMDYVREHLQDSDLTLKKIAEQYLYMNVDYVSRKFRKSTGKKFSQYLTEQRVKKAKELLLEGGDNKIQYVAEKVGCGNNPQYFSQIFKKTVGVTPGKWVLQMREK